MSDLKSEQAITPANRPQLFFQILRRAPTVSMTSPTLSIDDTATRSRTARTVARDSQLLSRYRMTVLTQ